MESNLIEGINPLIISNIRWFKGKRHGIHPTYAKYLRKKNPIRGFFGLYEPGLFESYWAPCVKIYGSDGDVVKIIACRSNDHAIYTKEYLTRKLEKFLSSLKGD